VETNWTVEEEQSITEAMTGLSRIQAIHHLRRRWMVGETRPPGWKAARAMPRENPRYGRTVESATQDRAEAPTRPDFRGSKASTSSGKGLETTTDKASTKSVRKAASARQARWRAKRAGQMPEQIAA